MARIKELFKDTAIYGLSSILGRFLNWALTPLYTRVLASTGEFGVQTNLYAWTALTLVLLTYGMETGFFHFVNKERNPQQVYSTALISLGGSSLLFLLLTLTQLPLLSSALGYPDRQLILSMLLIIVASDAFMAIPFAYLRYQKRPVRFAVIRFTYIATSIGFNLFFFLLCPYLWQVLPESVSWFYVPHFGIGYIFVSNLLGNLIIFLMLLPHILPAGWHFSLSLWRRMLRYSTPLLLLGLAGIFSQMADKILFPMLLPDRSYAEQELGVYGACFKIAVIMVMFTQAFRYAYEPFFFHREAGGEEEKKRSLAQAMKYFSIASLFAYVAVMATMDILKYTVAPAYYAGLRIIPIVMWGEFMAGVYFNLSPWYKLTERTWWGGVISTLGCIVAVGIMVWGVPRYSYMACAWAAAISNTLMVVVSYLLGQKYYPIRYPLKDLSFYLFLTAVATVAIIYSNQHFALVGKPIMWGVNLSILLSYCIIVAYKDLPVSTILQRIKHGK